MYIKMRKQPKFEQRIFNLSIDEQRLGAQLRYIVLNNFEIWKGSDAKSKMTNGFVIFMTKY